MLNVSKIFYLLARDEGRLIALVPLYLQEFRSADPLGLLISSAKLSIESEERGLFSHIIHCTDTTIPTLSHDPSLYARIFDAITAIAQAELARYFCFLNVQDGVLLREAQRNGLNINYMVDKFSIELMLFRILTVLRRLCPSTGVTKWYASFVSLTAAMRKFEYLLLPLIMKLRNWPGCII